MELICTALPPVSARSLLSSDWGPREEPSPTTLVKNPSFCSVKMFTKPTSSLVSTGWALASISVCEAHKKFMRNLHLEI